MENSPKSRSSSRLLLKKHRSNDSPKTPVRIVDSTDSFDTPSSFRRNSCDSPYSTPISRKRYHFLEESPSQDYDQLILPSQDVQSNILDVGWKWDESPSFNRKYEKKSLKTVNKKQEKKNSLINNNLEAKKVRIINRNSDKSKTSNKPVNEENHGFYKFRQELMKINSLENQDLNYELDSRIKENQSEMDIDQVVLTKKGSVPVAATTATTAVGEMKCESKSEPMVVDNINYNNLFDDSDTDNLLIELSQKIESAIEPEHKVDKENENLLYHNKTKESLMKVDIPDNDSFDDILLSIPIDDKVLEKSKKLTGNTINQSINNNSNYKEEHNSFKNILNRYNSMPTTTVINNNCNNSVKPFVRHTSMPTDSQTNVIKTSVNSTNISSTISKTTHYSVKINNRPKVISSSLEEIEKRRQEAKQRLMKTMQKRKQEQMKNKFS